MIKLTKQDFNIARPFQTFLDYNKTYYGGMCEILLDYDFIKCSESNNVELIWSCVQSAVYEALDLFVPRKRIREHPMPLWFTQEI